MNSIIFETILKNFAMLQTPAPLIIQIPASEDKMAKEVETEQIKSTGPNSTISDDSEYVDSPKETKIRKNEQKNKNVGKKRCYGI